MFKLLLELLKLFLTYLCRQHIKSDAGVNSIPCKDCELKYTGETSRNTYNKRLYEYERDIRLGNLNNAPFPHISRTDHNFDFNATAMLARIHNKK